MMDEITAQAGQAVTELLEKSKLCRGQVLVIGCSSSEMVGRYIGKGSSMEAARAAFPASIRFCGKRGSVLPSSAASISTGPLW